MQFLKQCKTCEFNFSGICAGHGNTYKYGDTITDDSLSCDDWGANLNYFTEITTCAPWYIREQYQDHRIDYPTFVELLDADSAGKAIKVNIFDAIKRIYGLSLVDLAVILNVSFGVMYRARSVGTPAKRLKNFSQTLCIPAEFFSETTTHDFPKIEQCKIEFEKQTDVNTALKVCPEWKTELARQVANTIRCPIHIAKEIARVDKLNWQKGMDDELSPSEKMLIDCVSKTASKAKLTLMAVEYSIDIASMPHFYARYLDNK